MPRSIQHSELVVGASAFVICCTEVLLELEHSGAYVAAILSATFGELGFRGIPNTHHIDDDSHTMCALAEVMCMLSPATIGSTECIAILNGLSGTRPSLCWGVVFHVR